MGWSRIRIQDLLWLHVGPTAAYTHFRRDYIKYCLLNHKQKKIKHFLQDDNSRWEDYQIVSVHVASNKEIHEIHGIRHLHVSVPQTVHVNVENRDKIPPWRTADRTLNSLLRTEFYLPMITARQTNSNDNKSAIYVNQILLLKHYDQLCQTWSFNSVQS